MADRKYERFKEDIVLSLKEEIKRRGIDAGISVMDIPKTNFIREAVIADMDGLIKPIFYLDDLYRDYAGGNMERAAARIIDGMISESGKQEGKLETLHGFLHSGAAAESITARLVNAEKNSGILGESLYRRVNEYSNASEPPFYRLRAI